MAIVGVKDRVRACLNLFRSGWERLEWNEAIRGRSFYSKRFVSVLTFQATEQPTRTETYPSDSCGGTAQLYPKTGVPPRGQRVLLTQRMDFHANILQGKPQRATPICTTVVQNKRARLENASRTTPILETLVCVVLVLVAVPFAYWTMMAELCCSVDDFILDVQYSSRHRK